MVLVLFPERGRKKREVIDERKNVQTTPTRTECKRNRPGRPTIWIKIGQGPIALAVGAGRVVWAFLLSSILSFLFLPLFGRRPDID